MSALSTAVIYFGSFLAIGAVAHWIVRRWMGRRDLDLRRIQADFEPRRGMRKMFLLGAWRDEGSDS